MGRKIKGSKHHGVKDPEKQRQVREDKIKAKINNRPQKEDFQEMPRSAMLLGNRYNEEVFQKRIRKSKAEKSLLDSTRFLSKPDQYAHGMKKDLRPVPVFRQREGEHKRAFYSRMERTIQSMKEQRKYENEFNVELKRDEHGQTKMVDANLDEVDQVAFDKKKAKLAKKGINIKSKEEKRQARRAREKARKNKKKGKGDGGGQEETMDFADFKDSVEFGEIVHQPPEIAFKHKLLVNQADRKPAAKSDLLLARKLSGGGGGGVAKKSKKVNKPSMARQVVIDQERQRVVEAYRALKAEKMQS